MLAAALVLAIPANADRLGRFTAVTPEAAHGAITLKDDALETTATLSSARVFRDKRGLLRQVPFDIFLRAFVDKASGTVRYQVYAELRYTAPRYAGWALANYETPTGPRQARLDVLGRIRGSYCTKYVGCDRSETVAFYVPEAILRAEAAAYRADTPAAWLVRLKARNGEEVTDGLSAAEIAGLLRAVDDYRVAKGFPAAR